MSETAQRGFLLECLAAARREGAEGERQKVANWMMQRSIPTGHGDTVEDLLAELRAVVADEMRERAARLVFDEYSLDGDLDGVAAAIRALPLTPEERA